MMIEHGLLVHVIFNIASRVVNVVDDAHGLLLERKNSEQWFCKTSMRAQWQCFMKAPLPASMSHHCVLLLSSQQVLDLDLFQAHILVSKQLLRSQSLKVHMKIQLDPRGLKTRSKWDQQV